MSRNIICSAIDLRGDRYDASDRVTKFLLRRWQFDQACDTRNSTVCVRLMRIGVPKVA